MESYGRFAGVYDVFMDNVNYREWADYIIETLAQDGIRDGLVLEYSIANNLILGLQYHETFAKNGIWLNFKKIHDTAEEMKEQFDIRCASVDVNAGTLSGGNQQKIIIAREASRDPDVLIAVQPTRGLDVGAIEYIHKQIVAQRDAGKAVLLVSLELDEVMSLSDRILAIYEGEIVGEFDPKTTTAEEMGLYMAGAKRKGLEKP